MAHLKAVLKCLGEAGLKLKPTKCSFVRGEVEYLGHTITSEGLQVNPKIIAAVARYPVLISVKQAKQFLGLASFYDKFVPGFAGIAQLLHSSSSSPLMKEQVVFHRSLEGLLSGEIQVCQSWATLLPPELSK